MHDAIVSRTGIIATLFVSVSAVAVGFFFFHSMPTADTVMQTPVITLIGPAGERVTVEVEIADTPEKRERGLMFRKQVPTGKGMLFSFTDYLRPARLSFWMKNTLVPLDILFFRKDGSMVSWNNMLPCMEEPCPLYRSTAPADYALEVPAGFIDQYDIDQQWRLEPPQRS